MHLLNKNTYLKVLNKHASIKQKLIRANEAPLMDKELKKIYYRQGQD